VLPFVCIQNFKLRNILLLYKDVRKVLAKILRRKIEKKMEGVLGEDQFGFRRGKGTRNATGMLRIISERKLEIDDELCVCFIDWQKALDKSTGPD